MALLRTAVSRFRSAPLASGLSFADFWPFFRTGAGVEVSHETALSLAAVWRAVNIRANFAASLPLHSYSEDSAGNRKEIKIESERYLWGRPNPEVNRLTFWSTVFLHLTLCGNAYIYVVPAASHLRTPAELWPIEPRRIRAQRDERGNKLYLIDEVTPAKDWLQGGEIVHIMGLSYDGLRGLSPISLMRETVGMSLAADKFSSTFFGNSSLPGGYLSTDQDMTPIQAQAYSEMWEEFHKGPENAHRVAVLGKGTKWNHTSVNPEDAQMLETRQFQVAEVSRIFGVPEHLLGSHDKQSSWGEGIDKQNRALLTYTVDPDLINVEQTITDELLRPQNHYAKFSRDAVLRGTPTERAEFYEKMVAVGAFTPNIILALEEMEGIGEDGDIRLRPANFVPLNSPAPGAVPVA